MNGGIYNQMIDRMSCVGCLTYLGERVYQNDPSDAFVTKRYIGSGLDTSVFHG